MGHGLLPELRRGDLDELRQMWAAAVVHGDWDRRCFTQAPQPCWFGDHIPGIDRCEGQIEGAHWLRRRRVEKTIAQQLELPELVVSPTWQRRWTVFPAEYVDAGLEFVFLAAWDPRNGVPACNKHHTRFDASRMPHLVVVRELVPAPVEAFARDWGLEPELARKCPTMGEGI